MRKEDNVTSGPQNADCIGVDNSDQPDEVKDPDSGIVALQ